MPTGGPIFILGAMGSGTTLLRLMLDSHPAIGIPQETGFMRGYDALRFTPFKWSGRNWTKRLGWSRKEFDALAREFYDTLFMRYAEQHGKRRWGEKTPLHMWHIADMARLFGDAQFVGIVRHPQASVASNVRRFNAKLRKSIWHWDAYNSELAHRATQFPERFRLLRYEDLVTDPEPVLRPLLDFLGEEWSDALLEHHEVQGSRGGRLKVEGRSRRDEPIDVSRIDRWKQTLTAEQQVLVGDRLAPLAEFWGYHIGTAAARDPLAGVDVPLVSGGDLAAALPRFPHLGLDQPREAPRYDRYYDPREVVVLSVEEYHELLEPGGARRLLIAVIRRVPGRLLRRRVVAALRRVRRRLGIRAAVRPKK